ncbi:MAG: YggS family pyridoxal phosphate-dependent enzyme [Chloroflexota bacterium]
MTPDIEAQAIKDNIARVQAEIATACAKVNRDPNEITLVAVSKKKPVRDILSAMDAGLTHFGENRLREAQMKIPAIAQQTDKEAIWHMIGHIQSRKAKHVVPLFDTIHSLDRPKIADYMSEVAVENEKTASVFIQVNISGEDAKYGYELSNWQTDSAVREAFWQEVKAILTLPNLEIRGLMTMAPYSNKAEDSRPIFAELAILHDSLREDFGLALPDLSMGMTNDFAVAIEEGATMIRVGRAIFGTRQ